MSDNNEKKSKKYVEDNFDLDVYKEITTQKVKEKRTYYNTKFINKFSYFMIIISFICVYILYNFFNKILIEKYSKKTSYIEPVKYKVAFFNDNYNNELLNIKL